MRTFGSPKIQDYLKLIYKMPFHCSVPLCKGNYSGGPKVSAFQFPIDDVLKQKWINAIKRKNFQPTKSSRVCELHFASHEIERVTTFFVERTGERASAPLKRPRLIQGAVPSKVPGASLYLSKRKSAFKKFHRTKRQKRECDDAILNSNADIRKANKQFQVTTHGEEQDNQSDLGENSPGQPDPLHVTEEELDIKPVPFQVKPFGDDFLRVCRTCFRIMRIEEAVPLVSSVDQDFVDETELFIQLKTLLQVDLFAVENPCLCKNCENFIKAAHTFMTACRENEDVLKEFEWDCKTVNLLHVVDQDNLKAVYDQVKGENPEGIDGDPDVDSELSASWREQDERGNGLSDMEDHWYSTDKAAQLCSDHDYTMRTTTTSCAVPLPKDEDLFSSNFDRHFEKGRNKVSQRLRKICKRYHNNDEGTGPFVCEFCGKVKTSKGTYNSHIKVHKANDGFRCTACNKVLFEWNCYLRHCKSVHGGCPRAFKCPRCPKRYLYKKMLDTHLRVHELEENCKYACLICRELFDDVSLLNQHKLLHGPRKIAVNLLGRSVYRGSLKRGHSKSKRDMLSDGKTRKMFRCNSCRRIYARVGCLKLHKKRCNEKSSCL